MRRVLTRRTGLSTSLAVVLCAMTASVASADSVARGSSAFHRGDYVRAARELAPAAEHGNARALGMLGFLYEHGFGVPQAYAAAADCYYRGAVQGDPFAQAQLGLMYDKGHGVPTDFVLAYKWLNLAAARSNGRQRDAYLRFRDAVASKLSTYEIIAGQRFALEWAPDRPAPDVHLTVK
ncbi:Sel1 repeat-containing protein [Bradyrhizobium brasilense]|uniref:Sel1 repeat-containing protein n=2 Tax=Bradyrhizobium brasilense TaxID=1419277 RepID=A0A1G6NGX0_9BRAD|nr:Sel1 repeat-containing protein [Bradyrhizobium brasilense]